MHQYRLTKYDPRHRDSSGVYTLGEWTFFAEVGSIVAGEVFTLQQYESVEIRYIQTIIQLVELAEIGPFSAIDLERKAPGDIKNGDLIQRDQLPDIVQDLLREKYWCRLVDQNQYYIHFGWDFYVYMGLPKQSQKFVSLASSKGLFLESCVSPYHSETQG